MCTAHKRTTQEVAIVLKTYSFGCKEVVDDVKDSEHFNNDCPIAERVANGSQPWCKLWKENGVNYKMS